MSNKYNLTAFLPTYESVRTFLRTIEGESASVFSSMLQKVDSGIGNMESKTKWSNLDEWMPKLLKGAEYSLALKLWNAGINPAYTGSIRPFVKKHNLLLLEEPIKITSEGYKFLEGDRNDVVRGIDDKEAIIAVLKLVAEQSGSLNDLADRFTVFYRENIGNHSEATIYDNLRRRLNNLMDRGWVEKVSLKHSLTPSGQSDLRGQITNIVPSTVTEKDKVWNDAELATNSLSALYQKDLLEYLRAMKHEQFELLIGQILERIGYVVEVTRSVKDGGVDVIADAKFGVSTIKIAVQVKRYKNTAIAPADVRALRGVLSTFKAQQGVFITLSTFTKATQDEFKGVDDIVLIDGQALIKLMSQNEIGMVRKSFEYFEFAPSELDKLLISRSKSNNGEGE